MNANKRFTERRFTATTLTDNTKHLTLCNGKADLIERFQLASAPAQSVADREELAQFVYAEDRLVHDGLSASE